MAKLGWRFLTSREDLWARILQAKYVRGKVDLPKLKRKQIASNAWKGMGGEL